MATLEQLVLDGVALNDVTNYRLQGFEAPPPKKKYEWAAGGDSDGSALVRDPLFENREITLRIRIAPRATMDLALTAVAQIVDLLEEAEKQPNGLDLVWTPANGTRSITFKVLSGEVSELPIALSGDDFGWFRSSPVIHVTLNCKPFGYGSESLTSTSASATPFVTITVPSVPGDVPAEGRLIVTDSATQNRRHLEWGLEQQHYNAATSLLVDSDNMVTSGFAGTGTTRSGAYDPNATGNNVIRATLYSPTAVCGTGNLSHVGTFRVKARVYMTGTGPVRCRLAWQEGDGAFSSNPWARVDTMATWFEVDLGIITVPPKELGTQRWSGRIEAYSDTAADTIDVDYLVLVPAGEGYGKARSAGLTTSSSSVAYDDFNSIGTSNLNARVASLGGTWATSGVATDFAGITSPYPGTAYRGTVSEATPRFAVLGATNYTDVQVEIWGLYLWPTIAAEDRSYAIARWTDSSNYLRLAFNSEGAFAIQQVVAGVVTTLASKPFTMAPNTYYGARLTAFATGVIIGELRWANSTNAPFLTLKASSTAVATGGTLATGKPGFADQHFGPSAIARFYNFFSAGVPTTEPIVVYSTRSAEIHSDSAIRVDSTNTYWGPVPFYSGARFLVPPAGNESRTSRVLVKLNRQDIDASDATNVTDNVTIQVAYTPRYSVVPR